MSADSSITITDKYMHVRQEIAHGYVDRAFD